MEWGKLRLLPRPGFLPTLSPRGVIRTDRLLRHRRVIRREAPGLRIRHGRRAVAIPPGPRRGGGARRVAVVVAVRVVVRVCRWIAVGVVVRAARRGRREAPVRVARWSAG